MAIPVKLTSNELVLKLKFDEENTLGKQVTQFNEGILPWSIQNPVALVFDEYDAGRPDVMFVIQRVLEAEGNFTLLDKNKVIKQST